jgi:hypothetical protein
VATYTTCSWCHEANEISEETCKNCAHDAQRPRMECTCPVCAGAILGGIVGAVLDATRRGLDGKR